LSDAKPTQARAKEAAELAQKAVELEPKEPGYLRTLVTARCRGGDNTGAIESAKRTLSLLGADWEALLVLALAHAREKQFDQALIWLADADQRRRGYRDEPVRATALRGEVVTALQAAGVSVPLQQPSPADLRKRYQELIDADPKAAWVYQLRAQTYTAAKERDKAEADYRRAFELIAGQRGVSLDDVEAVHGIGKQFLAAAQWDLNIAANTRLLELRDQGKRPQCQVCSTEVGLRRIRGGAYWHIGDFVGADADGTRAIELAPRDASNWASRATVRFNTDPQRALEDFAKAIELTPNRPNNWPWSNDYAMLLLRVDRFKEAATELKRITEAIPDAPLAAYYRALSLLAAGDTAGYRDASRAMLQHFEKKTEPAVLDWVTWTCALGPGALDDLTPAIALAERITAAEPKMSKYRLNHGALLYRAGRYREAVEVLTEVDRMMSDPADKSIAAPAYTWFFLSMSHARLGNPDEAARWNAKAAEHTQEALAAAATDPAAGAKANRWLTLRLLRDEAAATIDAGGASSTRPATTAAK
jgi:tetratricopeptide (TPR) repeat protein